MPIGDMIVWLFLFSILIFGAYTVFESIWSVRKMQRDVIDVEKELLWQECRRIENGTWF